MNDLDILFSNYCKEVNEAFDSLAMLVSLQKTDEPHVINILKEQENGNG